MTSENVPFYCAENCEGERVYVTEIGTGFCRVVIRYGFMEIPDVPSMLLIAFEKLKIENTAGDILYILGHEKFVEKNQGSMPGYQQTIFSFLSRNARNATDYFSLPYEQVIELGTQIDL